MWPFKKQERRHWPRRAIAVDVMYGIEPPLTMTTSVNMSAHSLAFHSSQKFEPGTKLEIQVLLDPNYPEKSWCEVKAEVARLESGLVAVEFLSMSNDAAKMLDAFFAALEASSPIVAE